MQQESSMWLFIASWMISINCFVSLKPHFHSYICQTTTLLQIEHSSDIETPRGAVVSFFILYWGSVLHLYCIIVADQHTCKAMWPLYIPNQAGVHSE